MKIIKQFTSSYISCGRRKIYWGLGDDGELYRGIQRDNDEEPMWIEYYSERVGKLSIPEMIEVCKHFQKLIVFL